MNSLTSSMFESIKSALTKETAGSSNKQKDFLRTEVGNTYTVRLLPNMKDPTKTFLHYYSHINIHIDTYKHIHYIYT